jgi:hypothetical protein
MLAIRSPRAALLLLTLGSSTAAAQTQPPAEAPPPKEVQPTETRLRFYGFVRHDVIVDDSRMDSAQSPLFVLSEADGTENRHHFTMHPRLTRFGIDLFGPQLPPAGHARLGGRIELDFQNGGRESRAIPRFRHAYLTLTWRNTSVLAGQTSDLISPLFPSVNNDTLMWAAGNLGDRRGQIRGTFQSTGPRLQVSLAGSLGLTGAVDQLDLDENGIRDGEASGLPNVQGRAGLTYPAGGRRFALGLWAHRGEMETTTAIAGRTDFSSQAVGLDAELPLGRRFVARGEAWTGRNLSDIRGGIGQAVNRTTGRGIQSRGGWAEVGGDVTTRYSVFAGITAEAPDEDDVPQGGRTRNGAWYIVNRVSAGRPFVVGADYLRWRTEYAGLPDGTDNRVNAYVIFNF